MNLVKRSFQILIDSLEWIQRCKLKDVILCTTNFAKLTVGTSCHALPSSRKTADRNNSTTTTFFLDMY